MFIILMKIEIISLGIIQLLKNIARIKYQVWRVTGHGGLPCLTLPDSAGRLPVFSGELPDYA
jgi:hypothetical protein